MSALPQTTRASKGLLSRCDVHLGLWILVLSHSIIAKLAPYPIVEWIHVLASTNLLVLLAFIVIFHLLTDERGSDAAEYSDFMLFGVATVGLSISSLLGVIYDIPFVMGVIGLCYLSIHSNFRNAYFIGLVYLALAVNGFLGPLIFLLFKDLILTGEVYLATTLNNLIGFEVSSDGTRLSTKDGMRLQLVGACSVYSNLSLAFLGYASFKAFVRKRMVFRDIYILLALGVGLVVLNTLRLGLMTPSIQAYEFWHHGSGVYLFALVQFVLIITICTFSILFPRRTCLG